MAKLALLLDEDIHLGLALALRKRGFDVLHVQELKRKGSSDSEQLAYAAREERCLLSFNIKDYIILHNKYVQQNKEHWGIIVSRQRPLGETLRRVLQRMQRFTKESIKNRIEFL